MKSQKNQIGIFFTMALFCFSCGSSTPDANKISTSYHMEKKYWSLDDYNSAVSEIKYCKEDEKLPNLTDPSTSPIFNKIIDINNVSIIVEDTTLGVKHRSEFSSEMFHNCSSLLESYSKLDKQDKYIYPSEIAELTVFTIYTEIQHFKLGNEKIVKDDVDPNDVQTKNVLNINSQTIVDNVIISIDFCKKEDALTPDAIHRLSTGIEKYFPLLIKYFPTANYSELKNRVDLLLASCKSNDIRQMLSKVKVQLNNIK